jgi:hypothetical protein
MGQIINLSSSLINNLKKKINIQDPVSKRVYAPLPGGEQVIAEEDY